MHRKNFSLTSKIPRDVYDYDGNEIDLNELKIVVGSVIFALFFLKNELQSMKRQKWRTRERERVKINNKHTLIYFIYSLLLTTWSPCISRSDELRAWCHNTISAENVSRFFCNEQFLFTVTGKIEVHICKL